MKSQAKKQPIDPKARRVFGQLIRVLSGNDPEARRLAAETILAPHAVPVFELFIDVLLSRLVQAKGEDVVLRLNAAVVMLGTRMIEPLAWHLAFSRFERVRLRVAGALLSLGRSMTPEARKPIIGVLIGPAFHDRSEVIKRMCHAAVVEFCGPPPLGWVESPAGPDPDESVSQPRQSADWTS